MTTLKAALRAFYSTVEPVNVKAASIISVGDWHKGMQGVLWYAFYSSAVTRRKGGGDKHKEPMKT